MQDYSSYIGGNCMLVQYQKRNLEKLQEVTKDYNELVVVGSTNSGRKYVVENWGNSIQKSIIIELNVSANKVPYSALISAINEVDYFKKDRLKITPTFAITGIVGSINASLEKDTLFKTEVELIKLFSRAAKRHTIVFIIDKAFLIEDGSIELIEKFRRECKKNKNIYIIYVSNTAEDSKKNIYFDDISTCGLPQKTLLRELNLVPYMNLNEKVINFIFNNISNNIYLLLQIIEDINTGNLDVFLNNYDKNHTIDKLLEYSENKNEYKKQLSELLSICAISEHYFQSIDFAYLLEEHKSIINSLLEYAQKKYLLTNTDDSFYILFGVVKKIYAGLNEIEKQKLYIKIVEMFTNVHPSKYYQKYTFAKLASMNGYSNYLVQFLFSEIRLNHGVDISKYKDELNERELNLVKAYNKAYGYNNSKEYDKCIEELSTLRELSIEFLYEINIVMSQALIKKMDELSRTRAISILNYEKSLTDENLKFRLNIRKIAALVHIGEYEQALISCKQTIGYLVNKFNETHALEYRYYLNVIYRKFSYVSAYDTSTNEVEASVDFFRKHQSEYHTGYYIALNNLLSLYIINMQTDKATNTKKELEELLIIKNNINFPRREILENNFLLYDFFIKSVDSRKICESFKVLYSKNKGGADHILITSNYSIFLMFNNEFELAEKILRNTIPDTVGDLEGIYDTRIKINLAICKFLMDNKNRDECIMMLNSVQYNQQAPYYKNRLDELNNIKQLMNTIVSCNDANEWCEAFKSYISTPLSVYTTYQQGFVYTTLFNWDDD